MKILLIEDDDETAGHVMAGLRDHGHTVDHAVDGRDGQHRAINDGYDLLIVDRMVPGRDGLSVVRGLRDAGCSTPVLFLSALSGIDDRVIGLNAGGDDYLVKPFALTELLARVNALGRRHIAAPVLTVLRVADLEMDLLNHSARRGDMVIDLQPREWRLLECNCPPTLRPTTH